MKKSLIALIFVLVAILALGVVAIANEAEAKDITISYMKEQNTTSDTTTLDKVAYENGKQTVKAGEEFTLPTTADNTYATQDGFKVVWYTENGRTYMGGEKVSFYEDTKLFRCVAKECYTMSEVNYAMANESSAAILMADIDTNAGISVWGQGQSVLVLNGHTITITKDSSNFMGAQRSGKHIYGEGTINAINPNGKLGEYYFFQDQSHSYNGSANRTVVGADVTINCPTMWLAADSDGSYNNHYPWTRIYGNVNCYGLYNIGNSNRAPFMEIYDGATVTVNGPSLFKDNTWRGNNSYCFNNQSFELRIYGGTFYLPTEATEEVFWTNDNKESYVDGTTNYFNYGLTKNTKDIIKIFGGSFVLPDNAVPAISGYLTADYIGAIPSGGDGLYANKNTSTYHIAYLTRPGYKLAFEQYTIADGAYGKLTVTDYIDGSLTGTYYYQMTMGTVEFIDPYYAKYDATKQNIVQNTIDSIKVFELIDDKYVETTKFKLDFAMSSTILFANNITQKDMKLQNLVANETTFQVAVPADCDHDFSGAPVDASCANVAYADYNCTKCNHNVYFSWGEKLAHNFVLGEHVEATLISLGSKSYACSMCGLSKTSPYNLDPSNLDVSVKIRLDDGTFEEITVKASEIFDFATSGSDGDYMYTLSAIKAFGDYKIRNIYGITIPKGIMYVNVAAYNYEKYQNVEFGVVELNIADGAKVDIQNIGNLRKVEKITVGKNTDVVFCSSCSYYNPSNEKRDMQKIATIDLSAGNHSVKFMSYAFDGRKTVTSLIFGENANYDLSGSGSFQYCKIAELNLPESSTYSKFGNSVFRENSFVSLVFPDNLDLTFGETFYNCKSLESVKFGENANYDIGNNCFRYSLISKVVFAPNSTYTVGSYAFTNTALEEIDMSAGNMTVTLNGSAFNCWLDNKRYGNVSTIKFGENSTYVIGDSALNDTTITEIVLAPNSTYTFKRYFINGGDNRKTFTTFDASANNITLVMEGEALRNHKEVFTTLKINGENSTYTFNGSAFYDTKITEVTLGKGSTYTFSDCFNGSTKIEKLDASADNITLTAKNWSFGKSSFKTLLINGKNGTYMFTNESLKNSIVTEIVLGEGSSYEFQNGSLANVNIATIDASANNLTVKFNDYVLSGRQSVTKLDISGENSSYTFGKESFKNTKITEIKAGANSTYSFGQSSFNSSSALTKIDFTASNVDATFINSAFSGSKAVSYLAFGEESQYTIGDYIFNNTAPTNDIVFSNTSTFKIGKEAFRYADFASIKFEDNCDVTFTGADAFKECDKATSLYIGKNIAITNYPFRNLKALETLYIMEGVTHASEYEFEYAGSSNYATPFYVYNHSLDFVFNKGLFKECDGIFVYTITDNIGTSNEVFANCGDTNGFKAWTVYLGLAHPLTAHVVNPDCVNIGLNTWIVDSAKCPCGSEAYFTETTVINKYENKHNIKPDTAVDEAVTFTVTEIAPLGHDKLGEKTNIAYASYLEMGAVSYICTRCNVEHTVEKDAAALFVFNGYSMPEDGRLRLSIGFIVNKEAISEYELLAETSISYGVACGVADQLNGKAPLDETLEDVSIVKADISKEYSSFDFVVSGFTAELCDLELVMAAYVTEGDSLVYLQDTQTDLPESISISKYLAGKTPVLPPEEEETPAA